jgi:predicted nucleic acid-binding protein
MKVLLDTNIIIHREASTIVNTDIGILFKWLDKGKYTKCIHPITVAEIEKNINPATIQTFRVKLQSYSDLKTTAPMNSNVKSIMESQDVNANDRNDSILLNELFCNRVDLLITEDKKIHMKAKLLGIAEKVFKIESFIEKVVAEHPELVDYKVLNVSKKHFGEIDLSDTFFNSFREDYFGFDEWFNKKSDEIAYVTHDDGKILSFLFLKIEDKGENYSDISPIFSSKKRLKIGTFKVVSNGLRLGERFLKIIFDNAIANHVEEIYVTIFDKSDDQKRLINLLEEWGFNQYGFKQSKSGKELVLVKNFVPAFNASNPKLTYPYVSRNTNYFLVPIYPEYHTELLPDSILTTESPDDFIESEPHRNAIKKVYISRSLEKGLKAGDIIIFYRTGGYHKSVVTTLGIVENLILDIRDENDFVSKCRKRSIFTDKDLKTHWNYKSSMRPFIVNFLYLYSFPKRVNLKDLIEMGVIKDIDSAPRGFHKISTEYFNKILKGTKSNESFIID